MNSYWRSCVSESSEGVSSPPKFGWIITGTGLGYYWGFATEGGVKMSSLDGVNIA